MIELLPLPESVQEHFLREGRHLAALAANPYLARRFWFAMYDRSISAPLATTLIASQELDDDMVRHVIDEMAESRATPLRALLATGKVPSEETADLLERSGSSTLGKQILHGEFPAHVKLVALSYAHPEDALTWCVQEVSTAARPDDAVSYETNDEDEPDDQQLDDGTREGAVALLGPYVNDLAARLAERGVRGSWKSSTLISRALKLWPGTIDTFATSAHVDVLKSVVACAEFTPSTQMADRIAGHVVDLISSKRADVYSIGSMPAGMLKMPTLSEKAARLLEREWREMIRRERSQYRRNESDVDIAIATWTATHCSQPWSQLSDPAELDRLLALPVHHSATLTDGSSRRLDHSNVFVALSRNPHVTGHREQALLQRVRDVIKLGHASLYPGDEWVARWPDELADILEPDGSRRVCSLERKRPCLLEGCPKCTWDRPEQIQLRWALGLRHGRTELERILVGRLGSDPTRWELLPAAANADENISVADLLTTIDALLS